MRLKFEIRPDEEFVCAYCRVSTGHQVLGVPDQISQITLQAEADGFPSPRFYTDEGRTGATLDRPGWHEMWAEVPKHRGSHLFVWDIGRLIRDYAPGGELTILCQQHNVVIHDCDEGALTEDQLAEKIQFFTKDRKKIAVTLRRGREGAVRRGRYPYAALPGYRKTSAGVLEECPLTGPIMREILRRRRAGEAWGSLAGYANQFGLKPRRAVEFTARSLAQLCKNEVYSGRKTFNSPIFGWEARQASNDRRTEAIRTAH